MTKANGKPKTTNLDDLSIKELVKMLNQQWQTLLQTKDNITVLNTAINKKEENETLERKKSKD